MESNEFMRFIRNLVMANYTALTMFNVARSIREAWKARETILAAAETTMMIIAQQWQNIAMALVASAMVTASFAGGYLMGARSVKADIRGDLNTLQGQHTAMAQFRAVVA